MQVKNDPNLLFPLAIAMEVFVFLFVGAYVVGKVSGLAVFSLTSLQIMLLVGWGYVVLKYLKDKLFIAFWLPVIVLLMAMNIGILVRLANGFFLS